MYEVIIITPINKTLMIDYEIKNDISKVRLLTTLFTEGAKSRAFFL